MFSLRLRGYNMEAILYLFQRHMVNSMKELKKKPLKLILYIAMGLLIIGSVILSIKSNHQIPDTKIETYRAIFSAIILLYLFLSLKAGIEKGNTLFRLSDANFLFTAPIKPQLVLFYGFIKQMGSNFILIMLLAFQMPNLYNNFPIKSYGWAIVLFGTFLFTILASIMGVLIYSIASIKESYKKVISAILYGLTGLILLGLIIHAIQYGEPLQGAIGFLNRSFFDYMPIISWLINIYTAAVLGFSWMTGIYIGLIILVGIGCLVVIYNLDLDYYEDALNNSLIKEEQLAKTKSGKVVWNQSAPKTRKTNGYINDTKGRAILSKQILEAKKTGSILIDKSTILSVGFSLVFAYIVRKNGVNFLLYMLVYMNLLISQSNRWGMELEKHYIYLIPESSVKKIIYATFLENVKAFIIGLITFMIATFIYDISFLQGIVLGITYGTFTSVILFSDLVIRRILGAGLSVVAERLMRFLIMVIMLIPGLIVSFVLGLLINKYTAGQGTYLVLILYNILISLLLIVLSKGIFEKIDMK